MRCEDRIAIVTGAGGGIGAALCRRFAEVGARSVVAIDSDATRVEEVAATLRADGGPVVALVADVSNEEQIRQAIEHVEADQGAVDILVQNAGHFEFGGPEAPDDAWMRCLAVNLMAHVYGARAVLPGMLHRADGYIVNMCSAAGLLTDPAAAPYAVSKHAAVAFAEWLAIACRDTGVRVSAVCPQSVDTPMLDVFMAAVGKGGEDFVGQILSPREVANQVLAGILSERFMIYPHATTVAAESAKVSGRDAWIATQPRLFDIRTVFSTLGELRRIHRGASPSLAARMTDRAPQWPSRGLFIHHIRRRGDLPGIGQRRVRTQHVSVAFGPALRSGRPVDQDSDLNYNYGHEDDELGGGQGTAFRARRRGGDDA